MASTQSVTTTCTYSTAALAACPTRKRRGITADEDDEEVIDASAVESVVPTQAAEITDSREKRQYLADYDVNAALQSSYYFDPQNAGSVRRKALLRRHPNVHQYVHYYDDRQIQLPGHLCASCWYPLRYLLNSIRPLRPSS